MRKHYTQGVVKAHCIHATLYGQKIEYTIDISFLNNI